MLCQSRIILNGFGGANSVIARSSCDEAIQSFLATLDCLAEPVIGRAFARPVGSQ
jgi:hypothetical protein